MLRRIESVEDEKRALAKERERINGVIQKQESHISSLRKNAQAKEEQKIAEMDRQILAHSGEMEQLQLQAKNTNTLHQLLIAENEAEITELKSNITGLEIQIENNAKTLIQERKCS